MTPKRRWNDFRNLKLKHKLEIILVIFTFAAVIFTVLLILFWAIYPYKTIEVSNVHMEQAVVSQGEIVNYETDYVKYMDSESVHRFFVDGLIFDAGTTNPIRPVGEGHGVQPVQIPRTLPPGVYRLRVIIEFKPNPIRTIDYEFYTPEFQVVASADPASSFDYEANPSDD